MRIGRTKKQRAGSKADVKASDPLTTSIISSVEMIAQNPHADEPLLVVDNLRTSVATADSRKALVDGVSIRVRSGETLGVVGESGSGKSMMVRSIMDLLAPGIEVEDKSAIRISGVKVLELPTKEARKYWGPVVSMVFQDPRLALNPVRTIGSQLTEPLRLQLGMSKLEARERACQLLNEVGISTPERRMRQYPHEFSGGMCQRIVIALALSCGPRLLIADEPTSGLDVTVQRQILELLAGLQAEHDMSTVLITHDIGVVAHFADRVAVMSNGKIVEQGKTRQVLRSPEHPYTRRLISAVPDLPGAETRKPADATSIEVVT